MSYEPYQPHEHPIRFMLSTMPVADMGDIVHTVFAQYLSETEWVTIKEYKSPVPVDELEPVLALENSDEKNRQYEALLDKHTVKGKVAHESKKKGRMDSAEDLNLIANALERDAHVLNGISEFVSELGGFPVSFTRQPEPPVEVKEEEPQKVAKPRRRRASKEE